MEEREKKYDPSSILPFLPFNRYSFQVTSECSSFGWLSKIVLPEPA